MTLNEGLKALSNDPANLVLTHYTWPSNKYIQMSCPTKKIGNIGGISDGPMTLRVISTINEDGYTENSFSRKNYKDPIFESGWVILDNDTWGKRLLRGIKVNFDLKPENDMGLESLNVNIQEKSTQKFSKLRETQQFISFVKLNCNFEDLYLRRKLDKYIEDIDNAALPKEESALILFEKLFQRHIEFSTEEEFKKVKQEFNRLFPHILGPSNYTVERIKEMAKEYNIKWEDIYSDELEYIPSTTANNILTNRLLQARAHPKKPKTFKEKLKAVLECLFD